MIYIILFSTTQQQCCIASLSRLTLGNTNNKADRKAASKARYVSFCKIPSSILYYTILLHVLNKSVFSRER